MNLVKTIEQYNHNNLIFCEPIKNNIMNDGNFSIVGLLLISTLFAAFCYLFSEGALKLFSISDM